MDNKINNRFITNVDIYEVLSLMSGLGVQLNVLVNENNETILVDKCLCVCWSDYDNDDARNIIDMYEQWFPCVKLEEQHLGYIFDYVLQYDLKGVFIHDFIKDSCSKKGAFIDRASIIKYKNMINTFISLSDGIEKDNGDAFRMMHAIMYNTFYMLGLAGEDIIEKEGKKFQRIFTSPINVKPQKDKDEKENENHYTIACDFKSILDAIPDDVGIIIDDMVICSLSVLINDEVLKECKKSLVCFKEKHENETKGKIDYFTMLDKYYVPLAVYDMSKRYGYVAFGDSANQKFSQLYLFENIEDASNSFNLTFGRGYKNQPVIGVIDNREALKQVLLQSYQYNKMSIVLDHGTKSQTTVDLAEFYRSVFGEDLPKLKKGKQYKNCEVPFISSMPYIPDVEKNVNIDINIPLKNGDIPSFISCASSFIEQCGIDGIFYLMEKVHFYSVDKSVSEEMRDIYNKIHDALFTMCVVYLYDDIPTFLICKTNSSEPSILKDKSTLMLVGDLDVAEHTTPKHNPVDFAFTTEILSKLQEINKNVTLCRNECYVRIEIEEIKNIIKNNEKLLSRKFKEILSLVYDKEKTLDEALCLYYKNLFVKSVNMIIEKK